MLIKTVLSAKPRLAVQHHVGWVPSSDLADLAAIAVGGDLWASQA
jgi:hypothetical protein